MKSEVFTKCIFVLFLLVNALFAIDAKVSVSGNEVLKTKKLKYIKKIPNDRCLTYIEASNTKNDEFGKPYQFILDDFNYKTGYTKFLVYKLSSFNEINQSNPIDSIIFINDACANDVAIDLNSKDDKAYFDQKLKEQGYNDVITQFKEIRDINNPNSKFNKELHELENRYLNEGAEFTSTGNKKFLTTSSYLLACLTFNEKIIDIKRSLELNKIVLQEGYTIYPNNIVTETKEVKVEDNSIFSFGNKYKKVTLEKLGAISEFLSENIILFIFKFRADIDPLLLKIKTILLFLFVPASGILLMLTKTTKKIGKIGDFDDLGEKAAVFLFLFVMFYFTGEGHKVKNQYGEEKSIHLNNYQYVSSTLLFDKMMDISNEVSNIFSKNYINFKRTSAGFNTDEEIHSLIKESLELQRVKEALIGTPKGGGNNLLNECKKMYDITKIRDRFNLHNISYPGRGQYEEFLKSGNASSVSQFYTSLFNEKTNIPYLSIPLCNQFERELREVNKQLDINADKLNLSREALLKRKEQEQLLKIAKIQYKTSAELGVIAIPQVAVTNIVTDNLGLFNTSRNNEKLLTYMQEETERNNLDNEVFLVKDLLENLPYMVVPGASSIQEFTSSIFGSVGLLANHYLKGFGSAIGTIIKKTDKVPGTIVAVYIVKAMVTYFPIVALSMASLMVISWYFISVFVYSLASPFIIVYAISTQQTESIKAFLVKGIALAFKPILIIISIVIAILAVYLTNDLSIIMFEGNFSLLIDTVRSTDSWSFADYLMTFFKGLVLVGASLIGVISAFYFVFNGSEILLGFIGLKDAGIDVKDAIGTSVSEKSSKYSLPGV